MYIKLSPIIIAVCNLKHVIIDMIKKWLTKNMLRVNIMIQYKYMRGMYSNG